MTVLLLQCKAEPARYAKCKATYPGESGMVILMAGRLGLVEQIHPYWHRPSCTIILLEEQDTSLAYFLKLIVAPTNSPLGSGRLFYKTIKRCFVGSRQISKPRDQCSFATVAPVNYGSDSHMEAVLIRRCSIGIPILKIRLSRRIFTIEISIPEKRRGPGSLPDETFIPWRADFFLREY